MTAKQWDALADDFSSQVLEITGSDIDGVIAATAKRLGGKRKSATDFGCGAGAVTRVIAPCFKRVVGVDFSPKLIAAARAQTAANNVEYEIADLQARRAKRYPCDVAFCANVLIGDDTGERERVARNVIAGIEPGGHGVFIVPSLEAVMRAYQMAAQLRVKRGAREETAAGEIENWAKAEIVSLPRGVVKMGGVATKHYLKDELAEFLARLKLRDIEISRVSYPWREALDDAPRNLEAAPPWDWIAVGVKGA